LLICVPLVPALYFSSVKYKVLQFICGKISFICHQLICIFIILYGVFYSE
jgi:hypothetical protein